METIQDEKDETLMVNVVPSQILRFDMICRVCGNENEKNIQIFGADGQNYELAPKINSYLPIKVMEGDHFPAGCCWTCASSIISWHDLVMTSIETDRKIKALQVVLSKPINLPSERTEVNCETIQNQSKETPITLTTTDQTPSIQIQPSTPKSTKSKVKKTDLAKYKVIINGNVFYQCDLCENRYEHGYNLTRHKLNHTNGPKSYTCDVCEKRYSTKSGLKRHHDENHTSKRYVCRICNGQFRAKVTLTQHMNIHTDTRPFVCDVCGKKFRQESSLRVHKMYHNTNFRFKCDVCGKEYRRNCELKVHMTLHTGVKPYSCKLCGKKFRLGNTLKKHIKLHDRLDICRCDVCGASFSQLRYLNNHKKIHDMDTSNVCT